MYIQLKIDAAAIDELKNIIGERVEKVLSKLLQNNKAKPFNNGNHSDEELLTRKDVMKMLQISHATLYNYQRKEILSFLKVGNRVYFRKEDIFDNINLYGNADNYKDPDE